jgi:3-oxoadipate enol-lactonase
VSTLAAAVLRLGLVEERQPRPFRLRAGGAVPADLTGALFDAAGLRRPTWVGPGEDGQGVFDRMADAALAAAASAGAASAGAASAGAASTGAASTGDPVQAVAAARGELPWSYGQAFQVRRPDGMEVSGVAVGEGDSPVVVFGAPGLPLELTGAWLRALGSRFPVASWETRGLFGWHSAADVDGRLWDLGVTAQVGDAIAVLDFLGWARASVMGLCGGAAVALALAASHPDRVSAVSLWLGDYETGSPEAKSDHQRNLHAVMDMAVAGSIGIERLHEMILTSTSGLSAPDLAPLALYPYASPDLFLKYCLMNSGVMGMDCRPLLPRVKAPAQVVASTSDSTVHPAGSVRVAEGLGIPVTEVSGHDHLGIFRAPAECAELATRFLSGWRGDPARGRRAAGQVAP